MVEQCDIGFDLDVLGMVQFNDWDVSIVQVCFVGFVECVYVWVLGDVVVVGVLLVDLLLFEWVVVQCEFFVVWVFKEELLMVVLCYWLLLLGMFVLFVVQVECMGEFQGCYMVIFLQVGMVVELMVCQGMMVFVGVSLVCVNGLVSVWIEVVVFEV